MLELNFRIEFHKYFWVFGCCDRNFLFKLSDLVAYLNSFILSGSVVNLFQEQDFIFKAKFVWIWFHDRVKFLNVTFNNKYLDYILLDLAAWTQTLHSILSYYIKYLNIFRLDCFKRGFLFNFIRPPPRWVFFKYFNLI